MREAELMAGYGVDDYRKGGTEDDLLATVTEALTFLGWRWQHVRRSDLAIVQGSPGFPDIIAIRDGLGLALELKAQDGRLTHDQVAWLREYRDAGWWALVIRPSDVDDLLRGLSGNRGAFTKIADRQ